MQFTMPIIKTREDFTWVATRSDRHQAERNHRQSLERLKERGGVSWCELAAILENRPHRRMAQDVAQDACMAQLQARTPA